MTPKALQTVAVALLTVVAAAKAETRTYDLRDVLIVIPDYDSTTPPGHGAGGAPKPSKDDRFASVVAAICGAMPKASAEAAEARELEGQLILTTDAAGHAAAERVLGQMRANRSRQVMVECRVLRLNDAGWTAIGESLRERLLAAGLNADCSPVELTADERDAVYKLGQTPGVTQVSAPRLTCFNGQRATIVVNNDPAVLRVAARPATTADGAATAVSLDYELTETRDGKPSVERLSTLAVAEKDRTLAYVPTIDGKPTPEHTVLLLTCTPVIQRELRAAR